MEKANSISPAKDFMRGLKDGIPIGLGFIPISIACGVAAAKVGFSFLLSQILCMLVYSGSGQVAALNLFEGGETAIIMYAITILVMNCRYMLFSTSLAQRLDPSMSTFERIVVGIFNTDEIFGVVTKEKDNIRAPYFFGVATLPYIGFALGNVFGAFFTNLLPESVSSVMKIMIFGMFIALIVPPAKQSKPILTVVLMALGLSVIMECIPVITACLTPGWIIIICAIVTATVGAILFPMDEKEEI